MPIVTGLDGRQYEVSEELLEKSQIRDDALASLGKLPELPEAPPVVPGPPPPRGVQVVGGQDGSPYVEVKPGPNNGVIIEVSPVPRQP